ncbi:MAG: hypothetical protein E6F98_07955 [Actinobacteria bacterium]|nr:MAG: hypothetical protein E6F98_07955 [Actinomycetota bacterium]
MAQSCVVPQGNLCHHRCVDARVTVGAALLAASLAGFSTAILIVLASLAAIAGSVPDRVGIAILISAVSGGFQGQGTDIEIQARETINLKRRLEEIIAQHSNQPVDKVSKDMERDYYMTSDEAREYGLVDTVVAHR